AAVAFAGYTWWPNGDYRPIQRGERGTIEGAVTELAAVPSGRPALTKQRAQQLGGAPFRNQQDSGYQGGSGGTPTSTTPTTTTTQTGTTGTTPAGGASGTVSSTTGTTTTPTVTET